MNYSDVLLILPPGGYYAERWKAGSLMPPLGLFYLAVVLEQNGFRVAIIDAHLEPLTVEGVASRTIEINPKVIGVSFSTDNRFPAFATIEALKNSLPQTPLVLGGPHPSLTAEDILTHIAGVDYIVRGVSEIVFVKLLHAILENPGSIAEIPGVSFRQNGVVVRNP
jgi:anaerobic magnesium-protoporphyrin IX monomethyl ester cyclase